MLNLHTRIGVSLLLLLSLQVSYANIDEKDSKKDTLESKKDTNTTSLEKDLEGLLKSASNATMLSPSVVQGDSIQSINDMIFQSSSGTISRAQIENSASGNGDITSLLRTLPNVQFSTKNKDSYTPGEIDPADISISGGLFYQNNFILDGANINNDLDPAISQDYNPYAIDALPGKSQGMNIDTSLLESIQVLDSNISAEYGGFTGGVVEAKTRKPQKKLGGQISYQYTNGNVSKSFPKSLTRYILKDGETAEDVISDENQDSFYKYIFRAALESKINDKLGIIANLSTTQSTITQNGYANSYMGTGSDATRKEQKRQSHNAFIKAYYAINDTMQSELSYAYMPQYNTYFIRNTKDSDFDMLTGGHQINSNFKWHNTTGELNLGIDFNSLKNSRTNSAWNYKGWRNSADKNWGLNANDTAQNGTSSEGGYGNVDSTQNSLNFRFNQKFNAFHFKNIKNIINIGGALKYTSASYERLGDTIQSGSAWVTPLQAGENCSIESQWCSTSPVFFQGTSSGKNWANNIGQYATKANIYKAGKISLEDTSYALFVEDTLHYLITKNDVIDVRLGVRMDGDSYVNTLDFAPRLSASYHRLDFGTSLSIGANRYYGRNIFAYKLKDGRSALEYEVTNRAYNQTWEEATWSQNKNDTNYNDLKTPYVDEYVIGIAQELPYANLNLKYIRRQGKDEVRKACFAPDGTFSTYNCTSNIKTNVLDTTTLRFKYVNTGTSKSDIITFSAETSESLILGPTQNIFAFNFDWMDTKRSYDSYDSSTDLSDFNNAIISYDGKFIRYGDKPSSDFSRPWTARISTTTTWNALGGKWLWNNFLNYRSAYDAVVEITGNADKAEYNGEKVATFKTKEIGGGYLWDMRLGYERAFYKGNTLFINIDVFNVLNAKNETTTSATYTNGETTTIATYETGRQIWLQVGYKF